MFSLTAFVVGLSALLSLLSYVDSSECQRIRRRWDKLTDSERDLYISGLLEIRWNGNGQIVNDELISIASSYADSDLYPQTSGYIFSNGYIVWELESRIRNLGGKWACFAMPYWDFTMESHRETAPAIFEGKEMGGFGDPDNHWTVNGYSWTPSISEYWVPANCIGKEDKYPLCSLKRSLTEKWEMPTASFIGYVIQNNPNFVDYAKYSNISASAIHLIDGHDEDSKTSIFDPIWYLLHSAIQFQHMLWMDCNQYDLIDINDLDQHSEAFTAFPEGKGIGLDDVIVFGGNLKTKHWSYINKNDLTIRKMYDIESWNIMYDLEDESGFYTESGLAEYCEGKLNDKWFIQHQEVAVWYNHWSVDFIVDGFAIVCVVWFFKWANIF